MGPTEVSKKKKKKRESEPRFTLTRDNFKSLEPRVTLGTILSHFPGGESGGVCAVVYKNSMGKFYVRSKVIS